VVENEKAANKRWFNEGLRKGLQGPMPDAEPFLLEEANNWLGNIQTDSIITPSTQQVQEGTSADTNLEDSATPSDMRLKVFES